MHGAVARLAEDAYVRLDPAQQADGARAAAAPRRRGRGRRGRAPPRRARRARRRARAAVVAGLADRRLLTVSDGAVEVAHEALLREWPRLRGWLEEDAEGRRLHRHLGDAARDWDADGRDPGELYRGARLAAALDWAADHDPELNATERAFLDASRRASGRAQRRLRMVLAGVAVAARARGDRRRRRARPARQRARRGDRGRDAQRLGAQALAEDDLDRSLLLARQGVALDDSPQTRGNLLAALLKSPAAIGVLRGDGDRADRASPSAPTAARSRSSTTTARCASSTRATRRPAGAGR